MKKLDLEKLHTTAHVLKEVRQDIHRGSIDEALINIENFIKAAVTEKKERRSKLCFDKECYRSRMKTTVDMHTAKKERTEEALQTFQSSKKEYKELLKQKRKEHNEKKTCQDDREHRDGSIQSNTKTTATLSS
ncbi:hypothetical protein C0J52_03302 [Blattella germanica]|nr:hypothetical protein C0J52_03302 [Blattella germanica]